MIPVKAEMYRTEAGEWCIRLVDVPKGLAEEFYEDYRAAGHRLYVASTFRRAGASVHEVVIAPCGPVPK